MWQIDNEIIKEYLKAGGKVISGKDEEEGLLWTRLD